MCGEKTAQYIVYNIGRNTIILKLFKLVEKHAEYSLTKVLNNDKFKVHRENGGDLKK